MNQAFTNGEIIRNKKLMQNKDGLQFYVKVVQDGVWKQVTSLNNYKN